MKQRKKVRCIRSLYEVANERDKDRNRSGFEDFSTKIEHQQV
ncbi:hypothetical protein OAE39_01860 [Akkermansiaceae bacterium]|nr:hypothetical protein [Akkermansiaceae bacterium]